MTEPLEKGMISSRQVCCLLILTILPTAVLFVPAVTAAKAGRDGWLSMALGGLFGLIWTVLVILLVKKFPGQNFPQMLQSAFGKYPGKFFGLLFSFWALHSTAVIVREHIEFIITTLIPETPIEVMMLAMTLLTAWIVYLGLEVIARAAEFILPVVFGGILLVFFLALQKVDLVNLQPVLEHGMKPVLLGAMVPSAWMGEVILFTSIVPYSNKLGVNSGSLILAQMIIILILVVDAVIAVSILGAEMLPYLMFPTLSVARLVGIAGFFERMDALVVAVWLTGGFIKMSVFKYVAVLTAAQSLGLRNYRALVFPILLFIQTWILFLFANVMELNHFLSEIVPLFLPVFEVILPVSVLAAAYLREGLSKS